MRIGILGTGSVAQTLGKGFVSKGHDVMYGTRDPAAAQLDPAGTFAEAATFGDILVLCVKGEHAATVAQAARDGAKGKLVLDTTNPIEGGPDGVHWSKAVKGSCLQMAQAAAPGARFVKAWNCVPGMEMVDPKLKGGPGTQFICGDDAAAKKQAQAILKDFGWDSIDIGGASMAPYIEACAVMVINHGVRSGRWDWGLKLLSS